MLRSDSGIKGSEFDAFLRYESSCFVCTSTCAGATGRSNEKEDEYSVALSLDYIVGKMLWDNVARLSSALSSTNSFSKS